MAKEIKLKWLVCPEPTGRFRSFETRGFPTADYPEGQTAARIVCSESYMPSVHKDATNLHLELHVACYENGTFKWRRLNKRACSIAEAKQIISHFINKNRKFAPEQYRAEGEKI